VLYLAGGTGSGDGSLRAPIREQKQVCEAQDLGGVLGRNGQSKSGLEQEGVLQTVGAIRATGERPNKKWPQGTKVSPSCSARWLAP
jgi:hypothetical protein